MNSAQLYSVSGGALRAPPSRKSPHTPLSGAPQGTGTDGGGFRARAPGHGHQGTDRGERSERGPQRRLLPAPEKPRRPRAPCSICRCAPCRRESGLSIRLPLGRLARCDSAVPRTRRQTQTSAGGIPSQAARMVRVARLGPVGGFDVAHGGPAQWTRHGPFAAPMAPRAFRGARTRLPDTQERERARPMSDVIPLSDVRDLFDLFNVAYWGDCLYRPRFVRGVPATDAGCPACIGFDLQRHERVATSPAARLNATLTIWLDPRTLERPRFCADVLMHEMVHQAVWALRGGLISKHDEMFNRECTRVGARLGLGNVLHQPDQPWPASHRPVGYYGSAPQRAEMGGA